MMRCLISFTSFSLGYFSGSAVEPRLLSVLWLLLLVELSFFSERGPLLELNRLSMSAQLLPLCSSGALGGRASPPSRMESPGRKSLIVSTHGYGFGNNLELQIPPTAHVFAYLFRDKRRRARKINQVSRKNNLHCQRLELGYGPLRLAQNGIQGYIPAMERELALPFIAPCSAMEPKRSP